LHLADCYVELGRDADAAKILLGFKLREGDPNADAVLRRLGAISFPAGERRSACLAAAGRPGDASSASVEACGELAGLLSAAGLPEMADSLLDVRGRRHPDPEQRFEAGRQRIALRQSAGDGVLPPDPALLVAWLRGWPGGVADGEAVLALAESASKTQRSAWAKARAILENEPRTRLLARLLQLAEGVDATTVGNSIDRYAFGESSGNLRLAAKVLSSRGLPGVARKWMSEVHSRREANPVEDTALVLAICQADGDAGGLREWRDRLTRFPGSSSRLIDFAAEFFPVGHPELALEIMRERYDSFPVLAEEHRYFLNKYARHLIREGALDQAHKVLLSMFQKTLGGDPSLLVDYYRAAGSLDRLEGELDKYYLSKSERERVLSLLPPAPSARHHPETSANR